MLRDGINKHFPFLTRLSYYQLLKILAFDDRTQINSGR